MVTDDGQREARLLKLYEAHAQRDVEAALAGMTEDVEWPNVAEGTRLRGHDQLRAYWTAQFAAIDPHVDPTAFEHETGSDEVIVTVHQVVRALDGALLQESVVTHTFTFRGDLVGSMRVGSPS